MKSPLIAVFAGSAILACAFGQSEFEAVPLIEDSGTSPQEAFVEPEASSPPPAAEAESVDSPPPVEEVAPAAHPVASVPDEEPRRANDGDLQRRWTPGPLWDTLTDNPLTDTILGFLIPGEPAGRNSVTLSTSLSAGYDSNVYTTNTDVIGSGFAAASGFLGYSFGSERFKISLEGTGSVYYYDNRPGDNQDVTGSLGIHGEYAINRRLNLTGGASVQYLSQPDPTLIGNTSRFAGDYSVQLANLELSYSLLPRFAIVPSYALQRIEYAEQPINEQLGYLDQTFALGFNYLIRPRFILTLQYRYNPLTYYETNLGSDGHLVLVGFNFNITPRVLWSFQTGGESRTIREPAVDGPSSYFGPFLESTVAYDYSPDSNVSLNLRFGTEPSGVSGVTIRQTLRARLGITHALTSRLLVDGAIFFQRDNYDLPGSIDDFSQDTYTAAIALRYKIGPLVSLVGNSQFSALSSDQEFNEYTRNVTSLGVELNF